MAATAVYAAVSRVPYVGQALDGKSFSNIGASTAAFFLQGGKYVAQCKASTYGTVTLQILLPDGTTWGTAATAFAADGISAPLDLPPGNYRFAVA